MKKNIFSFILLSLSFLLIHKNILKAQINTQSHDQEEQYVMFFDPATQTSTKGLNEMLAQLAKLSDREKQLFNANLEANKGKIDFFALPDSMKKNLAIHEKSAGKNILCHTDEILTNNLSYMPRSTVKVIKGPHKGKVINIITELSDEARVLLLEKNAHFRACLNRGPKQQESTIYSAKDKKRTYFVHAHEIEPHAQ